MLEQTCSARDAVKPPALFRRRRFVMTQPSNRRYNDNACLITLSTCLRKLIRSFMQSDHERMAKQLSQCPRHHFSSTHPSPNGSGRPYTYILHPHLSRPRQCRHSAPSGPCRIATRFPCSAHIFAAGPAQSPRTRPAAAGEFRPAATDCGADYYWANYCRRGG